MGTLEYWTAVGAAFALGAALGSLVTLRLARARAAAELLRVTEEMSHKHASTAAELRGARARAQNEIELARLSFKRQLASAGDGSRVAVMEAEERLRAAYDEMDRLRRAAVAPAKAKPAAASASPSRPDFAATEIMAKPRPSSGDRSPNRAKPESGSSSTVAVKASGFAATEVMEEQQ